MSHKYHFYDPLYDFITFEEADTAIGSMDIFNPGFGSKNIRYNSETKRILPFLETFEFNRLAFLRQSGLSFLVYPSSTHNRFAHSIGCCYLGLIACQEISVKSIKKINEEKKTTIEDLSKWLNDREWREEFLIALLLHDTGHFPYSHTLESNLEFWHHFPHNLKHEDIACGLILGEREFSPTIEGTTIYNRFKKFMYDKVDPDTSKKIGLNFISELLTATEHQEIDPYLLCYIISSNEIFLKNISAEKKADIHLVHDLVSGLLDLDRIDHYRRDSYFNGLKFASNLNFSALLGGMTMAIDFTSGSKKVELQLSKDAIGHALTLLHSKDRLVHDCFENPLNICYQSLLHKAINEYFKLSQLNEGQYLSTERIEDAINIFFMTDEELFTKLLSVNDPIISELIFRIIYRKPYNYVGKTEIKTGNAPTIKEINKLLLATEKKFKTKIICQYSKNYLIDTDVSKEWLSLSRLFNTKSERLENMDDYKEQIRYFKYIQESKIKTIWFFISDLEDKIKKQIQTEIHDALGNCRD